MPYKLTGKNGEVFESEVPGKIGGYRRLKISGRLDCPSAISNIGKGGYVKHRVFFADEKTAVAAGYRPCAKCLKEKYQMWKTDSQTMPLQPAVFENHEIRRVYDEESDTWWFSVVDIVQVLTQQADYQTARKYWNKLKERLGKEGSQSVTNCHRLKLPAADGKNYLTDVATAETLLRLVQSVPSPKAEPIKLWLAKVGYERMQEMADPALSLDRARETWQMHGRSEKWIQQRMTGQETRNKLTD